MNRRNFIKSTSALAVSLVLPSNKITNTLATIPDIPTSTINLRVEAYRKLAEWYYREVDNHLTWVLMHVDEETGKGYLFEERIYDEEARAPRVSARCTGVFT